MQKSKTLFSKKILTFFVGIFMAICVVLLGACTPLNQNPEPETPPVSMPSTTPSTPPQSPPNNFSSTTTRTEMAENMLGALATVKILRNTDSYRSSMGSGIAVHADGYLITNYHVIYNEALNPDDYYIKLEMMVGTEFKTDISAELLWYNASLDIAILKSAQTFNSIATLSDRWIDSNNRLRIAEEVWTLGTPYEQGLWGTYSQGTISSSLYRVGVTGVGESTYYHNYLIQHSAPISSGNSGGPLFDSSGNLIGLNTCGYSSSSNKTANGLFFAVPIYPVTLALNKVITAYNNNQSYTTPLVGISGYDKDAVSSFTEDGVYVQGVSETSSAFAQGLTVSAVIKGIGNSACQDANDPSYKNITCSYDLIYALLNYYSGDTITLFYTYNGQNLSMNVELS
ncbi:MAG: serine protease [Clostridia bacterium]|nr:serine protease [Clostridia bacterium]